MDSPRHTQLRRLISSAFAPGRVSIIDEQTRDQARCLVDLLEAGDCDLVDQISRTLPMWTIFEMVGLPPEHRESCSGL